MVAEFRLDRFADHADLLGGDGFCKFCHVVTDRRPAQVAAAGAGTGILGGGSCHLGKVGSIHQLVVGRAGFRFRVDQDMADQDLDLGSRNILADLLLQFFAQDFHLIHRTQGLFADVVGCEGVHSFPEALLETFQGIGSGAGGGQFRDEGRGGRRGGACCRRGDGRVERGGRRSGGGSGFRRGRGRGVYRQLLGGEGRVDQLGRGDGGRGCAIWEEFVCFLDEGIHFFCAHGNAACNGLLAYQHFIDHRGQHAVAHDLGRIQAEHDLLLLLGGVHPEVLLEELVLAQLVVQADALESDALLPLTGGDLHTVDFGNRVAQHEKVQVEVTIEKEQGDDHDAPDGNAADQVHLAPFAFQACNVLLCDHLGIGASFIHNVYP